MFMPDMSSGCRDRLVALWFLELYFYLRDINRQYNNHADKPCWWTHKRLYEMTELEGEEETFGAGRYDMVLGSYN